MKARPRPFIPLVAAGLCAAWWGIAPFASAFDFNRLQRSFMQRFGSTAAVNFRDWQRLIEESRSLPIERKLNRVNEFFNRRIQADEDMKIWGLQDYWATPLETLGKGQGDCEDFTIAKYFTLIALDLPVTELRLIYVKARIGGPSSNVMQAHMVLAHYAMPNAEPLVLDNLITDIRPASRRPDLVPVFSFNSQGIWIGSSSQEAAGGRLSRWQDLLLRARVEGFE